MKQQTSHDDESNTNKAANKQYEIDCSVYYYIFLCIHFCLNQTLLGNAATNDCYKETKCKCLVICNSVYVFCSLLCGKWMM